MHTYARVSGVKALPVFGRSVNPILTRGGGGGRLCLPNSYILDPHTFGPFSATSDAGMSEGEGQLPPHDMAHRIPG